MDWDRGADIALSKGHDQGGRRVPLRVLERGGVGMAREVRFDLRRRGIV